MKRRQLVQGALTGAASAVLGCRRRGTTIPDVDPDVGKKNVPETMAIRIPITGSVADVHQRLEEHVFEVASPGVHYARMLVVPGNHLLLSGVYDNSREAFLQFLGANASRLDHVLSLTADYPQGGAASRFELDAWLKRYELTNMLLYSAFSRGSEPAIRETVRLRDEFTRFVAAAQRQPSQAEHLYTGFLNDNRQRIDNHEDAAVDQLSPNQLTAPQRQNPFTMIFDVKKDWIKRMADTLKVGEWAIEKLHIHPLRQIPTVHYARFARISDTRYLFASVYDGEWEQYVTDFAVHIPTKLDKVWGGAVDYPKGGAADAPALQKFLEDHRIDRDYFYMAYANDTVKEIQRSLALGTKLIRFSKDAPSKAAGLVRHTERFVREHQGLLA